MRSLGRFVALFVLPLGALGLLPSHSSAAAGQPAYYVSATGSDSAAGTQQAPWRTIQKATSTAPPGATILVGTGSYGPFSVTKAGQTVQPQAGASVQVRGRSGVRDVVLLDAPGATLQGITVSGCVPRSDPPGGYNDEGSSAIRIDDGADGVTVQDVRVASSRGTNSFGLPFGCYGVFVHNANGSQILRNDISGTGTGVYLNGGGRLAVVAQNTIHDNDVLIRDTPGGDDDYGANGITFANVDALPGAVATGNTITRNSGPSSDYQYDGGAFEIYNSSHLKIVDNTLADNENVLETGTSPEGDNPLGDCIDNTFADNRATGRSAGSRLQRSVGLILRCATGMVVHGNTFTGIDWWVYDIFADDKFSSDVNGLAITGNTISQYQKVYHLGLDPLASRVVIEGNRFRFTGPVFASYDDGSTSPSLRDWQARSGEDRTSTTY